MIADYIKTLTGDATLRTLLSADTVNTKVYALVAPDGETSPWLVYSMSSQGTGEDVLDEALVMISAYGETYETVRAIMNRVVILLDIYEGGQNITSTDFEFLYSKMVPGGSDTREDGTRLYHLARLFRVKYKRRAGG